MHSHSLGDAEKMTDVMIVTGMYALHIRRNNNPGWLAWKK